MSDFLRLCPAEYRRPHRGTLKTADLTLEIDDCDGRFCQRLRAAGDVLEALCPAGVEWRMEAAGQTA